MSELMWKAKDRTWLCWSKIMLISTWLRIFNVLRSHRSEANLLNVKRYATQKQAHELMSKQQSWSQWNHKEHKKYKETS
jgi:hypothetical protein